MTNLRFFSFRRALWCLVHHRKNSSTNSSFPYLKLNFQPLFVLEKHDLQKYRSQFARNEVCWSRNQLEARRIQKKRRTIFAGSYSLLQNVCIQNRIWWSLLEYMKNLVILKISKHEIVVKVFGCHPREGTHIKETNHPENPIKKDCQ